MRISDWSSDVCSSDLLAVPIGDNTAYFPPDSGGVPTAQLWGALTGVENYAGASAAGRAHLLAEAGQRVFAARGDWLDGAADPARLVTKAPLERLVEGGTPRDRKREVGGKRGSVRG